MAPGDGSEAQRKPLVDIRDVTSAVLVDALQALFDEVTCIALHPCIAVVGTRLGSLWRLDVAGGRSQKIVTNAARIHCVSMDAEGAMVATGTADGRISVMPLAAGAGEYWVTDHSSQSPVLSVVLCPEYVSPKGLGPVVCAGGEDGRLVRYWYRNKMMPVGRTVLHEGEGAITKIVWRTPLICWANEVGVKLFNIISGQRVSFIPRPAPAPSLWPSTCQLTWAVDDHLLMVWGTTVKVAVVLVSGDESAVPAVQPANSIKMLFAKVRYEFRAPGTVSGIVATGPKTMGLLIVDLSGTRASFMLCSFTGVIFHRAEVPLQGGADPPRTHITSTAPHLPMYVIAPRDIVCLQIRDLLEYAVQLLEQGRFEEAIRLAESGGDGIQGLRHIVCLKSVVPQLREGRFHEAVQTMKRFQELEPSTWQECVVLFDRFGGLRHLVDALPFDPPSMRLPTGVYDEVLQRLVATPSTLQAVLSWWPQDIFSVDALAEELRSSFAEGQLVDGRAAGLVGDDRCRAEALAQVEAARGDALMAAELYRDLGSPEIFRLLRRGLAGSRPLAGLARGSIRRLFEIDDQEACAVFVEHCNSIPVSTVVEGLESCDNRWKHEYLKCLFFKDEVVGAPYHMQMVQLYATYEPQYLLTFLRASERYPLEDALQVCVDRGLLEEKAYLLGKVGRVNDALKVLLEELGDVGRAVQFAAEYQDPRLWEFLITFVLDRPHLLVPLLDHLEDLDSLFGEVGKDSGRAQPPQNAKAAHVLRRLPPTTPVSRIAGSVGRIFRSVELLQGLTANCAQLSRQEVKSRKRAIICRRSKGTLIAPDTQRCRVCGCPVGEFPPEDAVIVGKLQHSEGVGDFAVARADPSSEAWAAQALLQLSGAAGSGAASSSTAEVPGAVLSGSSPRSAGVASGAPAASQRAIGARRSGFVIRGQGIMHARCYEVSSFLGRLPTTRVTSLSRSCTPGSEAMLRLEPSTGDLAGQRHGLRDRE